MVSYLIKNKTLSIRFLTLLNSSKNMEITSYLKDNALQKRKLSTRVSIDDSIKGIEVKVYIENELALVCLTKELSHDVKAFLTNLVHKPEILNCLLLEKYYEGRNLSIFRHKVLRAIEDSIYAKNVPTHSKRYIVLITDSKSSYKVTVGLNKVEKLMSRSMR